jgi:outer membrane protein assembly factor BamD (BamD/ComL family)
VDEYSLTTIFADAEMGLDRVEKLVSDPSEREFHRIQKSLDTKTYEESIELLGSFLGKYPTSARIAEARDLLDENAKRKRTADNLYNFGRAYLDDGKYEIALGRYGKLIKDYSRSRWVPQARKEYEEALENLSE